MKKIILILTALTILTGLSFAYYLYNKPHQSIAEELPAFSIDAKTLVGDYDSDENKANTKYLGKIVEVKGVVAEKTIDSKGNYNIILQGPDLAGVSCEFEPNAQNALTNVKGGEEITIKGICTGSLMDVVLVDCVRSN
jgi:hypothetical protein